MFYLVANGDWEYKCKKHFDVIRLEVVEEFSVAWQCRKFGRKRFYSLDIIQFLINWHFKLLLPLHTWGSLQNLWNLWCQYSGMRSRKPLKVDIKYWRNQTKEISYNHVNYRFLLMRIITIILPLSHLFLRMPSTLCLQWATVQILSSEHFL